jgi:hypothetical protein
VETNTVNSDAPFVLEADVAPGIWHIESRPRADGRWWPAAGPFLQVSETGLVKCISNCLRDDFVHERKMRLLGPEPSAEVDEPRPVLEWAPVEGADGYTLRWFELRDGDRELVRAVQDIAVSGTRWQFGEDVVPHRVYQWDIEARADGRTVAWNSGWFLTPGATGRSSRSWLGLELHEVDGRVVVGAVVPDSPAEIAGLHAGDVVVAFEERPVESEDVLRTAIAAVKPGTQVAVRIRRGGEEEMTLRPVVSERPSR